MQDVTPKTVVELYELCLDICPFPSGDRKSVCPKCPLYKYAVEKQWRFKFEDAIKLVKQWATYMGKQIK